MEPAHTAIIATRLGLGANVLLAIVKGLAGWFGSSYALLADAVESSLDIFSSLIVALGLKISIKPPDENHPYGHGKAEPLAAVIAGAMLLGAAVMIGWQSASELMVPHHTPAPFTLLVLLIVIFVKERLFRYEQRLGTSIGSIALQSDAVHHRSDAITSLAAFIGVSVALIGGPGWERADSIAALIASGIITWNAIRIVRPALHELMDTSPPPEIEQQVREVAATVKGVAGLHRCRVRKMGFDFFVDLDVIVQRDLPVVEGHSIAHHVQDAVRGANGRIAKVFVHIEPTPSFQGDDCSH